MSSDEEDIEVAVEGADSNDENSDIQDTSDSYDDLEESLDVSDIEELIEPQNNESPTELPSAIDENILKSSLKDLIQLSCVR